MDAARLRQAVSIVVVAGTVGAGVAIAAHPFPTPPATAAPLAAQAAPPRGLAAREAQAVERLLLAEQRLRVVADAPPPVVSVAPAAVVPVTQSASS